jgi:hypothetical protein
MSFACLRFFLFVPPGPPGPSDPVDVLCFALFGTGIGVLFKKPVAGAIWGVLGTYGVLCAYVLVVEFFRL